MRAIVSRHAAAGVRKDPGPALRRESASAGGVLSRAGRLSGSCVGQRHACSRARNSRSTTSRTPTPPSSACGCSTSRPASSSNTPIPAAWPPRCRWPMPTTAPIAPIPPRHSAASSRSIASSMRPRRSAIIGRQFVEVIAAPSVSAAARRGARGQGRTCACSSLGAARASDRRPSSNIAAWSAGCWCRRRDTALAAARHVQDRHARRSPRPRSTRTCGSPGACAST